MYARIVSVADYRGFIFCLIYHRLTSVANCYRRIRGFELAKSSAIEKWIANMLLTTEKSIPER
jgi:hypothetical protein